MSAIVLNFTSGIAESQQAINTYLAVDSGASPDVYTVIANVGDQTGPSMTGDVVDVTSHSSTFPWSRKIVTLLNSGTTKLPLFFIPSTAGQPGGHDFTGGLLSIFVGRLLRSYVVQFPNPTLTQWIFSGYVTGFEMKAPVKGVLTADVTFTWTDEPVFE